MLVFVLMYWAPCMYSRPIVYSIHLYSVWNTHAEGMPQHGARAPNQTCLLYLSMPWSTTRSPRVRELIGVFGCCCCVTWCTTSLVWGSVRVEVAVQRIAQHTTSHSTAQHLCVLQHKTTTGNIYLALCQQHLGDTCRQLYRYNFSVNLVSNSNLGLINSSVLFKVK